MSRPSKHFWAAIVLLCAAAVVVWGTERVSSRPSLPAAPSATVVRHTIPADARVATFAGGCFWGIEEALRTVPGVADTRAGFTGGTTPNPTYETVHQDKTGHVEAVEVIYDPKVVTYETLLAAFFAATDPTLPTREGHAIGKSYRSFVFTHSPEQAAAARTFLERLQRSGKYRGAPRPIVTQIRPATAFTPAAEEHQRYYEKRGGGSCAL